MDPLPHFDQFAQTHADRQPLGIVLVDHGSRRAESNDLLLQIVTQFGQATGQPIVEPAHMELAEPSIATAFGRCVDQGARTVVVVPYFLLPGRHWDEDIPRLAAQAAAQHPGVAYLVTSPLGVHAMMSHIIADRVIQCLRHACEAAEACDLCSGTDKCQLRGLPLT